VQRQLHSLLATMVKLGGRRKDTPGSTAPMYFRTAATSAALALLAAADEQPLPQQQHHLVATTETVGLTGCRSSSSASVVAMLPNVVILGRCCMQMAEQMQENPGSMLHTIFPDPNNRQEQQQQQQQPTQQPQQDQQDQQQEERSVGSQQQQGRDEVKSLECDVITVLSGVQQWLAAGNTFGQLAAAGYVPLHVLLQIIWFGSQHLGPHSPREAPHVCTV
jgi:hypothetical protein